MSFFASGRLEAAKDDYRIHCEELEKQLVELQHRNDELTSLAEESRSLKDELDILRCVTERHLSWLGGKIFAHYFAQPCHLLSLSSIVIRT